MRPDRGVLLPDFCLCPASPWEAWCLRSFGGSRSRPAVGGYSTWVARPFGKSASYARLVVRGTCLALTILAPLAVSLRTGRCFVAKCHVGFRLACPPHRERTLLHIFAPSAALRSGDRLLWPVAAAQRLPSTLAWLPRLPLLLLQCTFGTRGGNPFRILLHFLQTSCLAGVPPCSGLCR